MSQSQLISLIYHILLFSYVPLKHHVSHLRATPRGSSPWRRDVGAGLRLRHGRRCRGAHRRTRRSLTTRSASLGRGDSDVDSPAGFVERTENWGKFWKLPKPIGRPNVRRAIYRQEGISFTLCEFCMPVDKTLCFFSSSCWCKNSACMIDNYRLDKWGFPKMVVPPNHPV